ncbi:hypothetical protein ABIB40_000006 [Pedobacter sp. UYP30]|uniref:hypothetical protein n=1 Tax=Pedobacter sp. UYP30 TaxID=1756400 RepID=UPI0033958D2E
MTTDKFIIHINTLYFFTYNLKNVEERKAVKKHKDTLIKMLGSGFETVLNALVKSETITYKNFNDLYLIKPLKQGAIDITSIESKKQPTNKLIINIREMLKRVTIQDGIKTPPFFNLFAKHNHQYISHFFNEDSFVGRLHTPISNLHRVLRPYLLIDSEPTAHIDINTAQPLFLARTLNEVIGDNEFTNWVYSGADVYNELLAKSSLPDRDTAKKKFLKTLFNYDLNEIINLYGNSEWAQWVNWYKSNPEPRNKKIKSWNVNPYYNNLAWLLQKIEVQTMRKVWQKLAAVNIPFLTVHDSVIIKQTDHAKALEIFHSVMRAEFSFYKLHSEGMPEPTKPTILPLVLIELQIEYSTLEQDSKIAPQQQERVKRYWRNVTDCLRNKGIGLNMAMKELTEYKHYLKQN